MRKGFVIPLILILVIAAVGIGAFWIGKNYFSKTSTPASTSSATPTTTDETANWRIYTSSKYGFSFKYPSSWTEKGPVSNTDTTIVYLIGDESFGDGPEPVQYYVWITQDTKLPNVKLTKGSAGGYIIYKTDELPSRSGALSTFITKDDKSYVSLSITPFDAKNLTTWPSQKKYEDIYNQILSTFRFTN